MNPEIEAFANKYGLTPEQTSDLERFVSEPNPMIRLVKTKDLKPGMVLKFNGSGVEVTVERLSPANVKGRHYVRWVGGAAAFFTPEYEFILLSEGN